MTLVNHQLDDMGDIFEPELMTFQSEAELIVGEKIDALKNEIYRGIKENQRSFLKRKKEVNTGTHVEQSPMQVRK